MGLRIAATVLATALMGTAAVAPAEARQPSGEPATQAKKKKKAKRKACKKGYVRKTVKVKRTRRVHGKRRRVTVKIKRCVKVKRKTKKPTSGAPPLQAPVTPQTPAGGLDQRDCQSQPGIGTYSNPVQVGTITKTVALRNCAPLTSGVPFNVHYFLFTLTSTPPSGSAVASRYDPALPAVSPRVVGAGGVTLLTYSADGFSVGNPIVGRAISITGLAPGTYRLGMEKLSSPLGSLITSPYDALIFLNN